MTSPHRLRPVYQQIAAILRQRIAAGEYSSLLPAERRLAEEFGVGRDAVRDALNLLRNEGLIDAVRGVPARVRTSEERQLVSVGAGVVIAARMPTPEERTELDIPDGVPLLLVGDRSLPANRYELSFG